MSSAIWVADLSKTPLLIQRKSKIDDKKSWSRFAFKNLKEKKRKEEKKKKKVFFFFKSYFFEKNRSVVFDIVYRTKYDKIVLVGRSVLRSFQTLTLKLTGNHERNITRSHTHIFLCNADNRIYLISFMPILFLLPKL